MIHAVILPVPETIRSLKRNEKKPALSDYARVAVHKSAELSDLKISTFEKGDYGEPLPSDGIHWSLAHTEAYVAGVVAPFPVGIDVERIAKPRIDISSRVANDAERNLADSVDDDLFCRYWTAKEAVLKAEGVGLRGLSECVIEEIIDERQLRIRYRQDEWIVSQFGLLDGHYAAVTVGESNVKWCHEI